MTASFSPCGCYRYGLWRTLQRQLAPRVSERGPTMLFVMLNPSTADDIEDDPTIRRCLGFVRREGYARLAVGNLFAYRATEPRALNGIEDPVGPMNDECLFDLACNADLIVAAWGAIPRRWQARAREVWRTLDEVTPDDVQCLGVTKADHPRHPLFTRANQVLVPFSMTPPQPIGSPR